MGQLIQSETGTPLSNATVKLLESDIGRDELLRVGVTNTEGKFEIDWKVRKVDRFDDFAELYTKFDGDDEHRSTSSKKYNVQII